LLLAPVATINETTI